jgi:hypothetical protein
MPANSQQILYHALGPARSDEGGEGRAAPPKSLLKIDLAGCRAKVRPLDRDRPVPDVLRPKK